MAQMHHAYCDALCDAPWDHYWPWLCPYEAQLQPTQIMEDSAPPLCCGIWSRRKNQCCWPPSVPLFTAGIKVLWCAQLYNRTNGLPFVICTLPRNLWKKCHLPNFYTRKIFSFETFRKVDGIMKLSLRMLADSGDLIEVARNGKIVRMLGGDQLCCCLCREQT